MRASNTRGGFAITLSDAAGVVALVILAGFSVYRARLVGKVYDSHLDCIGCLASSVWANDALFLAAFALILAVARIATRSWVRYGLGLVAAVVVTAYVADILVFRLLSQRLLLVDVVHFANDAGRMWTVANPGFHQKSGIGFAVAWALLVVATGLAILRASPATRRFAWPAIAAMLVLAWAVVPQAHYIHSVSFRNLWQVNRDQDPTRPYSPEFWARTDPSPPPQAECEPGEKASVSIVLVVVESLSACHSRLFCGLNDFTPNLDRLARRSAYFTNFYANGYSTDTALVALLTGHVPIPTAGWSGGYGAFADADGDFHRWLASRGYHTAFFTTGDTGIAGRDQWLKALGIGHVEGAEHPFYNGMPRASFNAAEDKALIDRFLQWHGEPRGRAPFMATLLTVATHPPFVLPATGVRSEAESFREMDRQVARLASTLEARGFFDRGVMIVIGDHRAMTPIPPAEFERLGPSAPVRVPAIAIGRAGVAPGGHDEPAQQTDLIPSLRHLLSDRTCRSAWQGRFLGGPVDPPEYLVHDDPLRRNELVLEKPDGQYRLLLDGDDTRWIEAPPSKDEATAVLREVNRVRMSRMAEFRGQKRVR
jgi:hypothetical protein